MYRNAHPAFGDDPDLPGGTLEEDEVPLETMVREVFEEAGIVINDASVDKLYEVGEYSMHKIQYSLYRITLDHRPVVSISWEHSSYEWLSRNDFLEKVKGANDTYMQMVYGVLTRTKEISNILTLLAI